MSRIRGPYVRFCERDEIGLITRFHPSRSKFSTQQYIQQLKPGVSRIYKSILSFLQSGHVGNPDHGDRIQPIIRNCLLDIVHGHQRHDTKLMGKTHIIIIDPLFNGFTIFPGGNRTPGHGHFFTGWRCLDGWNFAHMFTG